MRPTYVLSGYWRIFLLLWKIKTAVTVFNICLIWSSKKYNTVQYFLRSFLCEVCITLKSVFLKNVLEKINSFKNLLKLPYRTAAN